MFSISKVMIALGSFQNLRSPEMKLWAHIDQRPWCRALDKWKAHTHVHNWQHLRITKDRFDGRWRELYIIYILLLSGVNSIYFIYLDQMSSGDGQKLNFFCLPYCGLIRVYGVSSAHLATAVRERYCMISTIERDRRNFN